MPTSPKGFWVAMTKNGTGSGWATPSTVVWPSAMASSRADWARGVARLISSTSTTLLNTGPGRNVQSPLRWS